MVMSRLSRCVFGAADEKYGCCGSVYDLPADPLLGGATAWQAGVLEDECRGILQKMFNGKRDKA